MKALTRSVEQLLGSVVAGGGDAVLSGGSSETVGTTSVGTTSVGTTVVGSGAAVELTPPPRMHSTESNKRNQWTQFFFSINNFLTEIVPFDRILQLAYFFLV